MSHKIPDSLPHFLSKGRILLLGECHGSNEYPTAMVHLVRYGVKTFSKRVILHLEFPFWVKKAFNLWLLKGEDLDIARMRIFAEDMRLSSGFCNALISIKDLIVAGDVIINCFDSRDPELDQSFTQEESECQMAHNLISAINNYPNDFHIIYVGNVHAAIYDTSHPLFGFRTMGSFLAENFKDLLNINFCNTGGYIKNIIPFPDGSYKLTLRKCVPDPSIKSSANTFLYFDRPVNGFYGEWNIGTVTPADCLIPGLADGAILG